MTKNSAKNPITDDGRWPEGAIVYQIYPRSFQDANGDGVGDLPGIISRLDYLKDLGINAIWLSPFYPSPMADFGYDVADYCNVDPLFGNLDDYKKLLREAHSRDIKIIIDLVPNHSSDEHPWFKGSRKSKDNKYTDWYVWRDPHPESNAEETYPPNNWRDVLTGGPAWEWDDQRQQYYLHSFHTKQPDLNWSNPEVREAIKDAMRFWLDLGTDGFRVDAVYWMAKEPLLSDDSPNPNYIEGEDSPYNALIHDNSQGWPFVFAYLSEMSEVLREEKYVHSHRFMVTEAYPDRHNPLAAYMNFYVGMDPEVAAPFNFEGLSLPWEATHWRRFLRSFHHALEMYSPHCVPSYAFGNHDQARLASRFGEAAARSAAVMQLTLPGMAFVYYGEELGMKNVHIPKKQVQDPQALSGLKYGRDPSRTPMQWSDGKNAGFSSAEQTWLPVSPDYAVHNTETEAKNEHSFLNLYKALSKLRNSSDAIKTGSFEIVETGQDNVLGYRRTTGSESYVILVNFTDEATACKPAAAYQKLLISSDSQTTAHPKTSDGTVNLHPHEAVVFATAA